jgi:hypothetical protein
MARAIPLSRFGNSRDMLVSGSSNDGIYFTKSSYQLLIPEIVYSHANPGKLQIFFLINTNKNTDGIILLINYGKLY